MRRFLIGVSSLGRSAAVEILPSFSIAGSQTVSLSSARHQHARPHSFPLRAFKLCHSVKGFAIGLNCLASFDHTLTVCADVHRNWAPPCVSQSISCLVQKASSTNAGHSIKNSAPASCRPPARHPSSTKLVFLLPSHFAKCRALGRGRLMSRYPA